MKRILTGDRPTYDSFHLGNYVGSLKNRVKLQDEYDTYILVADLHALTTHFESTADLEKNIKISEDWISLHCPWVISMDSFWICIHTHHLFLYFLLRIC